MDKVVPMNIAVRPTLPDGGMISAMPAGKQRLFKQADVFQIAKLLHPPESIMTLRDYNLALRSGADEIVNPGLGMWLRCAEYVFFRIDPSAPLGREIIWAEGEATYRKLVPDIPVDVNGKNISLQKAAGMGVYGSIGLLKIEEKDRNLFEVSVVDPEAVIGKVRVVDFMRDGWVLPDETGLPIEGIKLPSYDPAARYGMVGTRFNLKAAGYHGSLSCKGHYVLARANWAEDSGVALINAPGCSENIAVMRS